MAILMDKYYTPKEVAVNLGVNAETVYRWLRSGLLKGTKVGKHLWRINDEPLQEFLSRKNTR